MKRAAFALMACLAVSDKAARDRIFLSILPLIKREASDERNYVRKAVNWALRQIGKRNQRLNRAAIKARGRFTNWVRQPRVGLPRMRCGNCAALRSNDG